MLTIGTLLSNTLQTERDTYMRKEIARGKVKYYTTLLSLLGIPVSNTRQSRHKVYVKVWLVNINTAQHYL